MKSFKIFGTLALLCVLLGLTGSLHGQEKVAEVMRDRSIDWEKPTARAQAVQRIKAAEQRELNKARQIALKKGKPFREELPGGGVRELIGLDEDGELLYYETKNTNAAISTGADQINLAPFSLDGAGLLVGVWDGGSVLSTHQEFNEGASSRVNIGDGAASNYHATHVGGTIGAFGVVANAKGMANQSTIESYDWFSDIGEMTAVAATSSGQFDTKVYLSNHSYGYSYGWRFSTIEINGTPTDMWKWTGTGTDQNAYDADFGQYSSTSVSLDSLAYNSPYYLIFWAAGNENTDGPSNGQTCSIGGNHDVTYNSSIHPQNDGDYSGGFDTIGDHGVAKNLITMGAANDAVTGGQRDPSRSSIASFSSTGPVDDGRIKPDLVANGVSLYSSDNGNDTDYRSLSGTSMATPNATGSATLLIELYRELFGSDAAMRASTLKGLLIHTASDVGNPGPDYTYGWGLVDVKTAADLLQRQADSPNLESLVEDELSTAQPSDSYTFSWDGTSPIRATLSWTDPAGNSQSGHNDRTPDLVNDLNLKLIAPDGTEYFPFVMPFVGTWTVASMSEHATTGVNNVDNVEQVLINNPGQNGTWQIEITYAGTLTNNEQEYGLIVSGGTEQPLLALYPTGGETMYHDTIEELTWYGDITGNIKLELYKGGAFHSLIANNEENDGSYYWTVPSSLSADNDYAIKVTSIDNSDDTDTTPTFSIAGSFTPSPLAEAVDATEIEWSTSGDASWFSQSTTTHDGVDAAESGNVSDNQTSIMQTTVNGPGTLTFWWKVSSESNYDYLRFLIDGLVQTGDLEPISGTVDWVQKTVAIPSGSHTVEWRYVKDFSVSNGSDAGWVDQVVYTPDNPPQSAPEITVQQPLQNYLTDGAATIDFGTVNAGSSSSPVTFTVSNSGTADLTGLSLLKTGTHAADYTFGTLGATSLAPGESTTFTITYSPSAQGTRTAAVEIASNDSDENPFDINLTGFALDPTGLVVTINSAMVSEEDGSAATTATVTRETDTHLALTVSLSSSDETEATVPASVSMIAGQTSVAFDIAAVEDSDLDGTQTVTITASGVNHSDGSAMLDVADNETVVTYDGNDNDQGAVPADQTKVYNTDLTLSGAGTLSRLGYDFDGWNTAADGSGNAYAAGATYSANEAVTLYAQWVSGPAAIYEAFAQTAGSLDGQTGGVGLSGSWGINQTVNVVNPATLSYGDLPDAGGQVELPNGNGVDAWITTSSGLADSNLLDDGPILWFSLVYQKTSGSSSNEHSGFAFGTERVDAAYNGARMNSGYGVGFYSQGNSISVATWNNGGQAAGSSHTISYSTPVLIVGKVEWGATAGDDETITLYTPSLNDLSNLGSGVTTTAAGFDQTLLDTVSFTQRNSGGTQTYDEIRFGATYESVTGQGDNSGITVGSLSNDTSENGTTGTFTVVLDSQPTADVIIGISSSDTGEGTVSPSSLTFTDTNWDTPQTVTITGVDDLLDDGDQVFTIVTAPASSADNDYNGLDADDVTVTNIDDDFTLTVVAGAGGDSVTGGGVKDEDNSPYAITATAATGYSFVNWTVTAGSATFGDANSASTTVSASDDATVQANFALDTYSVTYSGNGSDGGAVPVDNNSYNFNDMVAVLGNTSGLTKTDYEFEGWNTASDGSGTSYVADDTFTITADTMLYAQWNLPPFDQWAGEGSSPSDDTNGDGISDGLAWVIGASAPSAEASALMPTSDVDSDPDYYVYTYRRSDEAHNDPATTIDVIFGDDMLSWNPAVHDGSTVVITEHDDDFGPGVDRVEVKIDWDLFTGDNGFVRLRVDISN